MSIQLVVDSATVYDDAGGTLRSGAGLSTSIATATAVGRATKTATASSTGGSVAAGRLFSGNAGFAAGTSVALGQGVALGGGGSSQRIQLVVDTATVYDAGGGFTYVGAAAGTSSAQANATLVWAGRGQAAGTSAAAAQGLLPNQALAIAAGRSTAQAGVLKTGVGVAAGIARAGSPLDILTPPPLTGRSMTTTMQAAIQKAVVRPAILYQGQFKDGTLNLWSGIGQLRWNNLVWEGAGKLLTISPVEETDQQQASGIVVSLTAVPSSHIALSLASVQRNLPGQIWLALIDESDNVIEKPQTIFRGRLDSVTIDDGPDEAVMKASYENEMITLEHAREVRYTDQEQQRLFPGDKGLEFIASLQDKTLRWGSRA